MSIRTILIIGLVVLTVLVVVLAASVVVQVGKVKTLQEHSLPAPEGPAAGKVMVNIVPQNQTSGQQEGETA